MKQTLRIAALALLAGMLITVAEAQAGGTKVNVPFQFIVGGKTYTAGQYVVRSSRDKVQIQLLNGQTVALVATDAISGRVPDRNGKLVFNCYFDRCFLSQVWTPGQDAGRALPKSKREIQLAKAVKEQQFALLGTGPQR